MTPETAYFLDKARRVLIEADSILAINICEVAGRMAYLAGFHAAQAFISEQTGRSVKTHKGVHGELYRLTKNAVDFDAKLRTFLSESYDLKTIADYEIGPGAEVSPERTRIAVEQAKRFVAYFESKLSTEASTEGNHD
jgi:uncharacterized protein (UPF0332 family)